MYAHIFHGNETWQHASGLPTETEIVRIRHTIKMLKKHESDLMYRISQNRRSDRSMVEYLQEHACNVTWGWQELIRRIESLPDSFIQKTVWLDECTEHFTQSEKTQLIAERYWD